MSNDVSPGNDLMSKRARVFNIMNHLKNSIGVIDDAIVMDMKRVNNIGNFYNNVHKFINDLNNKNNINAQLDGIFNDSNKAKLTELDQEIIKSFNSVNTTINDGFYNDVSKFINELNNKNNINAQLDGIFNDSNKAKLTKLDQEIIKSFNSVNTTINDGFYNDVSKFIDELNNKNNINAQLDGIFNDSNKAKLTKLDQEIIDTFTNDIHKSTKWLQYYYDLEKELRRAMKPDPMIAYRLGNVPTFLPKIGIGDITNKIGEKYGNMIDGIKGINIPSLPNVMPSYVDYDALDIVFTESEDGKMDTKKILDKGVTTQ